MARPARKRKLAPRQERFIQEYLVDLSATQAAIRAGYSIKTGKEQGYRLLTNVHIQQAIETGLVERSERTQVTQDRVVQELAYIAFARIDDLFTWTGDRVQLRDTSELSESALRAISSIDQVDVAGKEGETRTTLRLKLYDKVRSLELLGRHLGMFADRDPRGDAPVQITRVTVVLPAGYEPPGPTTVEGQVASVE